MGNLTDSSKFTTIEVDSPLFTSSPSPASSLFLSHGTHIVFLALFKTMAPIKVGLMGYGSSTKLFHLPFILPNPDYKVVAFLQRAEAPREKSSVEPGKHCTVDHHDAKHHRTAEDFFKDEGIELVIVCTSSDTHYEFGMKALEAGKHGLSTIAVLPHSNGKY